MKSIFFLAALTCISNSWAQSDSLALLNEQSQKDITVAIKTLFDGMKEGDSTKVATVFHDDLRMMSSYVTRQKDVKLHEGTLHEFLEAIGTPHEELWDERYSNVVIQVDDNLAQVWMDYSFYIDDKFSHCGVNAFQMVKDSSGWKILQLTDTRRRGNCEH